MTHILYTIVYTKHAFSAIHNADVARIALHRMIDSVYIDSTITISPLPSSPRTPGTRR